MSHDRSATARARERGELVDAHTVRFERILPGTIKLVWDYLTKRELLATWLADSDISAETGEPLRLSQNSERVPIRVTGEIHGRVTQAKPPRLLAFTWRFVPEAQLNSGADNLSEEGDSEVIFELESLPDTGADSVRLTLTHRRVPTSHLPQTGAGWHAHLSFLRNELRQKGPDARPNFFALYEECLPLYVRALLQLTGA